MYINAYIILFTCHTIILYFDVQEEVWLIDEVNIVIISLHHLKEKPILLR